MLALCLGVLAQLGDVVRIPSPGFDHFVEVSRKDGIAYQSKDGEVVFVVPSTQKRSVYEIGQSERAYRISRFGDLDAQSAGEVSYFLATMQRREGQSIRLTACGEALFTKIGASYVLVFPDIAPLMMRARGFNSGFGMSDDMETAALLTFHSALPTIRLASYADGAWSVSDTPVVPRVIGAGYPYAENGYSDVRFLSDRHVAYIGNVAVDDGDRAKILADLTKDLAFRDLKLTTSEATTVRFLVVTDTRNGESHVVGTVVVERTGGEVGGDRFGFLTCDKEKLYVGGASEIVGIQIAEILNRFEDESSSHTPPPHPDPGGVAGASSPFNKSSGHADASCYTLTARANLRYNEPVVIAILLLLTQSANPTGSEVQFRYYAGVTLSCGDYSVTIEEEPFDVEPGRIGRSENGHLTIDGRTHLGVGRNKPSTQLRAIRATYNGRDLKVDPKLWADVYDLGLERELVESTVFNRVEIKGNAVVLKMIGGDGGVSYWLVLRIAQNGQHSRTLETP